MPTDPKAKKKTTNKKSVAKPAMSPQPAAVAKSKIAKAATASSGPSNPSGSGN